MTTICGARLSRVNVPPRWSRFRRDWLRPGQRNWLRVRQRTWLRVCCSWALGSNRGRLQTPMNDRFATVGRPRQPIGPCRLEGRQFRFSPGARTAVRRARTLLSRRDVFTYRWREAAPRSTGRKHMSRLSGLQISSLAFAVVVTAAATAGAQGLVQTQKLSAALANELVGE